MVSKRQFADTIHRLFGRSATRIPTPGNWQTNIVGGLELDFYFFWKTDNLDKSLKTNIYIINKLKWMVL